MILLVLLRLLLGLSLSLNHVGLVLVLLELVLNNALLDLLKGLPSVLLLSDAVIADHINKHDTSMDELLLLVDDELDVLAELVFASAIIGKHQL